MINKYSVAKAAAIIKRTRIEKGFTQQEMANKLNLETRQAFGNMENGKTIPKWEQIMDLCNIFECDVTYLLGEHPEYKRRDVPDICDATGLSIKAVDTLIRKRDIVKGYGDNLEGEFWHEDAEDLELLSFLIENQRVQIIETDGLNDTDGSYFEDCVNILNLLHKYLLTDSWFKEAGKQVDSIPIISYSKYSRMETLFGGLHSKDINEIYWKKIADTFTRLRTIAYNRDRSEEVKQHV